MSDTLPSPASPPLPGKPHRFHPETVFDLIRPIERIVESLAGEIHAWDLRQTDARARVILTVDRTLLDREPWSHVVPSTVREALVSRVLRTYWWSRGGVLETAPEGS